MRCMKYDMLFLIKRVTEGEIIFSVHRDLLSRSFCQFLAVFLHHLHHVHVFTYCGEGGVVQRSLQREKDSGDSGK